MMAMCNGLKLPKIASLRHREILTKGITDRMRFSSIPGIIETIDGSMTTIMNGEVYD